MKSIDVTVQEWSDGGGFVKSEKDGRSGVLR